MTDTLSNQNQSPTQKWGEEQRNNWLAHQKIQRSYQAEIANPILSLKSAFVVEQYGELVYTTKRYPLYGVRSKTLDPSKQSILVTGGVHGYETSGVHGALGFLEQHALAYSNRFNIIVVPCVSPWGYETINRWNPDAIDPNRSFYSESPSAESTALMQYISALEVNFIMHIDLHETTDTDNTTFRPALAARDGEKYTNWNIPDGFYLVGDASNPTPEFQQAIIKTVREVTHIAPADNAGKLIGEPITQEGVINYAVKELGLCTGITLSRYVTTTEVYPDSPRVTPENCTSAQIAAITAGLDFVINSEPNPY